MTQNAPDTEVSKPKLAVWKFTSCDGCQLSLLDCEDELLAVADAVHISHFVEATRHTEPGPYDLSIVEGSISTEEERNKIQQIRAESKVLIAIGACATAGGIQSLKNFAQVDDYIQKVYAHPEYIDTLKTATPISDHVEVDLELRGCPISKSQLLELLNAFLNKRHGNLPRSSVCMECKLAGNACVLVSQGVACLGPVTQGGCQALCPSFNRGCFGCFGPKENCHPEALDAALGHLAEPEKLRLYRSYNAMAAKFKRQGDSHES